MGTPTQRDQIIKRVNRVLVEEFEIDPSKISETARIVDDLGLDSLDLVDLVVMIEKEFGERIEEAEAKAIRTVDDTYNFIERKLDLK